MLALFAALQQARTRTIQFKYIPDGGNAGVKDVQAGRAQFAINTRPPLPERLRHDLLEAVPRRALRRVNPANSLNNISLIASLKNIFLGTSTRAGPRWRLEPDARRSTRSGATRPPARTRSSSSRCSVARRRRPTCAQLTVRRPGRDARRARPRTRSATSASPTRARQRRQDAQAQRRRRATRAPHQDETYPLFALRLGRAADARHPNDRGRAVPRLGAHQHGRRQIIAKAGAVPPSTSRRRRRREPGRQPSSRPMDERSSTRTSRSTRLQSGPARRASARRAGLRWWCCAAGDGRVHPHARRGRRSRTTAWRWFGAGRQRRPADPGDLHLRRPATSAGLHVPRLAADLGHDPDAPSAPS